MTRASHLAVGGVVELTVERAVYRGLGLARHEGQVVFVPRALPGDRVRVRIDEVTRGYVRGALAEVLAPSPSRRDPPCPYFGECGGCAYQHQDYEAQLALKEAVLRDALRRAGAGWDGPLAVRPSPREGWRMRATLHFEDAPEGLRLGLRQEGSRRVVDVETCRQLSPAMNAAARALRDAVAAHPHLRRRVGDVEIVESKDGEERVLAVETDLPTPDATRLSGLASSVPGLTGFGVIAGEGNRRRFLLLEGDAHVASDVVGLRLRSHVRSFFQANRFLVDDLVREVLERTPEGGTILDLYAGVGLFALPLARRAHEVRGLELNPIAVEDARDNAGANGLERARIHQGDVREMAHWPASPEERVVLDPPRTGAGADVVRLVAGRRPSAIVYVSCDPPTLGRDLKLLASLGYAARSVTAFDLFPDTFHLETVVALAPASA